MDGSKAKLSGVPSQHLGNTMEATRSCVGLVPWILLSRHSLEYTLLKIPGAQVEKRTLTTDSFLQNSAPVIWIYLPLISIKSLYVIVSHSQCWY